MMCDTSLSFDTVLDLCRSRTRRCILATLAERCEPVSLERLVETIRRHTLHDSESDELDGGRGDLRVSIRHMHLPKLEAVSVIEYDTDRATVKPSESFDRLEPHLSALVEADPDISMAIET